MIDAIITAVIVGVGKTPAITHQVIIDDPEILDIIMNALKDKDIEKDILKLENGEPFKTQFVVAGKPWTPYLRVKAKKTDPLNSI